MGLNTSTGATMIQDVHVRLDELRHTEYAYLDAGGHTYLDFTGAGLPSTTQLHAHAERICGECFGNPHSENPTSRRSTDLVEEARKAVLGFLNADPAEYAVIFTPNATGACRLVGEAYPFSRRRRLVMTLDNHNSVNGMREYARRRHAAVRYLPLSAPDLRLEEPAKLGHGPGLFAFPAQSNFSGVQHPLDLVERAHERGYDVLLDAAAFVPANRLDLGEVHPDFVSISWYKVLGYPTGVGSLVARHDALADLRRPWFSGGTITAVSAIGGWHVMADDESRFEDGTLNFLGIPDVTCGLEWLEGVGVEAVHERVHRATGALLQRLTALRHEDGSPMVRLYGPAEMVERGGTISFNFLDRRGRIVDERVVARDAAAAGISLRTGCFCNPGAGEAAFSLRRLWLTRLLGDRGLTIDGYLDKIGLPTAGAIRVSPGLVTTGGDVDRFIDFATAHYRQGDPDERGLEPRLRC
jgi:selenocysteine lyase/cysteine desulfurase